MLVLQLDERQLNRTRELSVLGDIDEQVGRSSRGHIVIEPDDRDFPVMMETARVARLAEVLVLAPPRACALIARSIGHDV